MQEFQPVRLVNISHYKNNKETLNCTNVMQGLFLAYFVLQGSNAKIINL